MRSFRLLTILAIVLSLPLFGPASIASALACDAPQSAVHDCCPDDSGNCGEHAPDHAPDHVPAKQDDCGMCSAMLACKAPHVLQAAAVVEMPASLARMLPLDATDARRPAQRPDQLLRPPQS